MAGWPRESGALAGWVARFPRPVGQPGALGGRFLTCQDQLAFGRQVQAILAPDVLDDDLALTL